MSREHATDDEKIKAQGKVEFITNKNGSNEYSAD